MDPENKQATPEAAPVDTAKPPADALSMTPEELGQVEASAEQKGLEPPEGAKKKGPSGLKKLFKRINIYLMAFIILLVIAGVVVTLTYLYSKKKAPEATIGSQQLSQDALKDLASSDTSVGNTQQRLTIKGDTTIDGQTLLRSNLDVAGNIQTSGKLSGTDLTISGTSNLSNTQVDRIQISGNTDAKGDITIGGGLSVAGASTFNGPMTASTITASQLVLSGNGRLEIPNHIAFTGSAPSQSPGYSVLGSGSSASLNGSDSSGTVTFSSGNNPTAGCLTTITFRSSFQSTPKVVVSPVDATAGNLNFYVKRTNTNFSICSNNPPAGNSTFSFDYFVAG